MSHNSSLIFYLTSVFWSADGNWSSPSVEDECSPQSYEEAAPHAGDVEDPLGDGEAHPQPQVTRGEEGDH